MAYSIAIANRYGDALTPNGILVNLICLKFSSSIFPNGSLSLMEHFLNFFYLWVYRVFYYAYILEFKVIF
ncbi:unnamed protein product [Caenorhabditis nigoni]